MFQRSNSDRLNIYRFCCIFIMGSLFGVIYEDLFGLIKGGFFITHRGVIFLPFNPLYGAGFFLVMFILGNFKKWYHIVILGTVGGAALEYLASWGLEFINGSRSWDYSYLPLNIHGRTTVFIAVFWGLLALVLVKGIYPLLLKFIDYTYETKVKKFIKWLMIFFVFDMFISFSALIRQGFRNNGRSPFTPFGYLLDYIFSNKVLAFFYPSMIGPEFDITNYQIRLNRNSVIIVLDALMIVALLFAIYLLIKQAIKAKRKVKINYGSDDYNRHAIIIPARDESRIIRNLLDSLKKQEYPVEFQDVYIIVESLADKTVEIAAEYGANIFLREDLTKRRKGYALDECFKHILRQNINYAAYFIFDADNLIAPDFIKIMNRVYNGGYDVAVGYRRSLNWNYNVISACSGLTFSMINGFGNHTKMIDNKSIIVSGTGFFISGRRIAEMNGFPFHTLTEDFAFSLFFNKVGYRSAYVESADFYDEQPLTMKQSMTQRTRWVKGFFDSKKEFKKQNPENKKVLANSFSIKRYVFIIVIFIFYYLVNIVAGVINPPSRQLLFYIRAIGVLLVAYIYLMVFTALLLSCEKDENLKIRSKLKILFFNPFFLATYAYIIISQLKRKDIKWEKIVHVGNVRPTDEIIFSKID